MLVVKSVERAPDCETVYDLNTQDGAFGVQGAFVAKNTDSIYTIFTPPGVSRDDPEFLRHVFDLAKSAADQISMQFPSPCCLEFEKCMYPFALYSKKRYSYVSYERWDEPKPKLCHKGFHVVRRDTCKFVQTSVSDVLNMLMIHRDKDGAIALARKVVDDLLEGRVPVKDVVISQSLSQKALDKFRPRAVFSVEDEKQRRVVTVKRGVVRCNGVARVTLKGVEDTSGVVESVDFTQSDCVVRLDNGVTIRGCMESTEQTRERALAGALPHVKMAWKLTQRDPASAPRAGDRVPYVLLRSTTKGKCDSVEDPQYAIEHKLPVDWVSYLDHQLRVPLDSVIDFITDGDIYSGPKKKLHTKDVAKEALGAGGKDIRKFFSFIKPSQ